MDEELKSGEREEGGGQDARPRTLTIHRVNPETGAREPAGQATLDGHGEAQISLDKNNGSRYLWQLQERDNR